MLEPDGVGGDDDAVEGEMVGLEDGMEDGMEWIDEVGLMEDSVDGFTEDAEEALEEEIDDVFVEDSEETLDEDTDETLDEETEETLDEDTEEAFEVADDVFVTGADELDDETALRDGAYQLASGSPRQSPTRTAVRVSESACELAAIYTYTSIPCS